MQKQIAIYKTQMWHWHSYILNYIILCPKYLCENKHILNQAPHEDDIQSHKWQETVRFSLKRIPSYSGKNQKALAWLTLKDPMPGSPVLVALLEAAGAGAPLSLASVPWLEADLAVWDMARGFRRVRVWGGGRQGDEQK